MSMHQFLAEYYGTGGQPAPSQEDAEKTAQAELFAKLAAESGVDLEKADPAQIEQAWQQFQAAYQEQKTASAQQQPAAQTLKTASDESEEKKEHKAKELLEQAEKEHEEKKAAAEKFAEADFLGRVMAHAYVDELKKIASDTKAAEFPPKKDEEHGEKKDEKEEKREEKEAASHLHPSDNSIMVGKKTMGEKLREHASHFGGKAKELTHSAGKHIGHAAESAMKHKGKAGLVAAGLAAGGAAGAAAMHGSKHKKASALDELAALRSIEKCAEANWDTNEAAERISAYLELDSSEATKIASAQDLETALEIRSLELLEGAGYPVTWNQ